MEKNMSENETTENQQIDLNTIIGALKVKVDAANAQILHLGLLVEYLYKELDEKKVGLDLDNYPEWAQKRFEEIQKMSEDEIGNELQQEMKKEMQEIANSIKLS